MTLIKFDYYKNLLEKYEGLFKIASNPLFVALVIALSGGFIYVCGNLFMMSYLLGKNYSFTDFLIDPLPLQYGHIIGTGLFVYILILILLILILNFQLHIENKRFLKVFAIIIILSGAGFLSTNLLNVSNEINYQGLIVVSSMLLMFFIISILINSINNIQVAIPAFLYWAYTLISLNDDGSIYNWVSIPFLGYVTFCILIKLFINILDKLKANKLKFTMIFTPIVFFIFLLASLF